VTEEPTAVVAPSAPDGPLTERVLDWIGEPEWVWILLWTGVSFVRPVVLFLATHGTVREPTPEMWLRVITSQLAIAWVTLVGFVGARYVYRRTQQLAPQLANLAPSERPSGFFRDMSSNWGPALFALGIVTIPSFLSSLQLFGSAAALSDLPLVFVNSLPSMTFVWTYLVFLMGVNRLGEARLALDPFPQDRSLGLRAIGSLALDGFWLLLLAAIPLMIAGRADLPTVVLSLIVIGISVLLLFLSMYRVHRQMTDAKHRYVAEARSLYGEAFAPVRAKPSLKSLEARGSVIGVAQSLLERAERIQEWPIDERATAWVVVVITGVTTGLIVRLILTLAGA
jgi:hypothetical protein